MLLTRSNDKRTIACSLVVRLSVFWVRERTEHSVRRIAVKSADQTYRLCSLKVTEKLWGA